MARKLDGCKFYRSKVVIKKLVDLCLSYTHNKEVLFKDFIYIASNMLYSPVQNNLNPQGFGNKIKILEENFVTYLLFADNFGDDINNHYFPCYMETLNDRRIV